MYRFSKEATRFVMLTPNGPSAESRWRMVALAAVVVPWASFGPRAGESAFRRDAPVK